MNPGVGDDDGLVEVGPYTLIGRLGQGTLGTTYLGDHRGQSRRFAIRILHRHLWEDIAATRLMFDEARTANRLNHPNVVQTLDVGRMANGVPYLVMEYVNGWSIDAIASMLVAGSNPDRSKYWCAIFASVLSGLGHAHGLGIVHGAISPSDIRVTEEGVPKLLGLDASILRESLEDTFSPRIERQLRYGGPELLRIGGRASTASDVFSVAVAAWEAFAGRPLYSGSSTAALMQDRLQGTRPPLGQIAPDVSEAICDVLAAALNPEPLGRPTVQAFAAVLRAASAGVLQVDLASWLDRLFPLGEEEATRVMSTPFGLAGAASPRSLDPTPPTGAVHPVWPSFPQPHSPAPAAQAERDPEVRSATPPVHVAPLPSPAPVASSRGWWMAAASITAVVAAVGTVLVWAATEHGDSSDAILDAARAALDSDRPAIALELVQRLDGADPETRAEAALLVTKANHRLELDRARVDLLRGLPDAAGTRIRRVLSEDPDDPEALDLSRQLGN